VDRFDHFILTRFNLNIESAPPERKLDPAWLDHRFGLFDSFCYPSVRGQSTQTFTWLVFFDSDTPRTFKEKVAEYSNWTNFVPVFISAPTEEYHKNMRAEIIKRMSDGAQSVVTTRLDNDDALGIRFVETLQKLVKDKLNNEPECINFTFGYKLDTSTSKLYLAKHQCNQFISLIEHAQNFSTVYCEQHRWLSKVAPVREVKIAPLWLEVVHGKNVTNKVYGVRKPVKGLSTFTIHAAIPSQNDNWFSCWIGQGQESLKRMVKRVAKLLLPRAIIALLRPMLAGRQ
jgi:hypothetical protein